MKALLLLVSLAAALAVGCLREGSVDGGTTCAAENDSVANVPVSWVPGWNEAKVDPKTLELCVGGTFPDAVTWHALVPIGYAAKLEIVHDPKASTCSDARSEHLVVQGGGSRTVKGTAGSAVKDGSCWGYGGVLRVSTDSGADVKGSPFSFDPEISWKR